MLKIANLAFLTMNMIITDSFGDVIKCFLGPTLFLLGTSVLLKEGQEVKIVDRIDAFFAVDHSLG